MWLRMVIRFLISRSVRLAARVFLQKRLRKKLLDKTIDIAVHSAKDVPMELADGLCLGAVLLRDDNRDVILKRKETKKIGAGSIIGTSSLRREIQIKRFPRMLQIKSLRGNVGTRIE